MKYPNPIIFVHGIQGAWLKDHYPVDYQDEIYWSGILKKKFGKLHLSTINQAVDQDIDRFIFPHQAVAFVYESIIEEIREEVTEQTYVFTYDWRKDNRLSAKRLGDFVKLVLTKAQTHARQREKDIPKKVSLVGHSMGGLVIKWYVTQILKDQAVNKINKIITIATPYRGSLKAIEALLPGARNFFGVEAQKAMRKASRTLPGVYQLLPSWEGAVVDKHTGRRVNIFKKDSWQENLIEEMEKIEKDFFQAMLNDAKAFTDVVKKNYRVGMGERFYCVFGTKSETWRQVGVDRTDGNRFCFDEAVEDEEGDGTVHKLSSREKVKAADYFEDSKKLIDVVGGQHAKMPTHGAVQDYIVDLFTKSKYLRPFESKI